MQAYGDSGHRAARRVSGASTLVVTAAAVALGWTAQASAQTVTLEGPVAAQPEAFGMIGGVRELSDGSVLVADPLGGSLFRLTADLGAMEVVGSEGEGPGEYRQPDSIWPIDGDRSLVVDLGNARLLEVGGDGHIGEGSPIVRSSGQGDDPMGGMMLAIPGGSDGLGHVYFTGRAMSRAGPRDSVELFRLDPKTGDPVQVATLKAQDVTTSSGGGGNMSISLVPMSPVDVWGATPDGKIFIGRVGDASIEVVSPDGSSVRGPRRDLDRVRIGRAEKEEFVAERSRNGGVMVDIALGGDGGRRTQMSRSSGGRREIDGYTWPEVKPPFQGSIRVDSEGQAWVRRSMEAGEPATFDVFDESGGHLRTVRLPPNRTLVSFGESAVYVARFDEFDQQFLEKYALP
ncbi:MAG: hypothetical protein OEU54_02825 [Gemmatimonadota bacterium]|nr:hypothetical protein [Gemmatimonadota bacterium]